MISLQCPHCRDLLTILPSGVTVACSCFGARQAEFDERIRRKNWQNSQNLTPQKPRNPDRKPR